MSGDSDRSLDRVDNPETHYDKPADIAADKNLSPGEKAKALSNWEQDARQLLTASNEGVAGGCGGPGARRSPWPGRGGPGEG